MSEVNSSTLLISIRIDKGLTQHNNRIFISKNVDGERVQDNITYCRQDIREAYLIKAPAYPHKTEMAPRSCPQLRGGFFVLQNNLENNAQQTMQITIFVL